MIYDKHGNKLEDETIVPDGGRVVVKHGDSIRVPVLLMDAAPDVAAITRKALADAERSQAAMHRPGSVALTDADRDAREKALAARDARLVGAWKNPPTLDTAGTAKPAPTTPSGDAADRRDARLRDAWRN